MHAHFKIESTTPSPKLIRSFHLTVDHSFRHLLYFHHVHQPRQKIHASINVGQLWNEIPVERGNNIPHFWQHIKVEYVEKDFPLQRHCTRISQ